VRNRNYIDVVRQQRLRGISVRRQHNMRNILSGLVAVLAGSYVIVFLLELSQPLYPDPFSMIWILLAGSSALQSTFSFILDTSVALTYVTAWFVIGLIIGPFSKVGWNTVRSAIWVGLIHAILALASLLLLVPTFWDISINPNRNIELLYQFSTSLILALLTLPSAIPTALLVNRLGQQSDIPVPTKIETICECGAIFKSRPLICSECGRRLSEN